MGQTKYQHNGYFTFQGIETIVIVLLWFLINHVLLKLILVLIAVIYYFLYVL